MTTPDGVAVQFREICTISTDPIDCGGNAHLIAAAPDMEAALRFVLSCFDLDTDGFLQMKRKDLLSVVRAAITKAEGI